MVDFAKALEEGFAAALRAEAAKAEIDTLLAEMRAQVLKATNETVQIERIQYEVAETGWPIFIFPPKPKEKYWAIAAFNPKVGRGRDAQLALWSQDRAGYPCKVTWNKQEHACEDREALAACLADLLADPIVGQKLYAISKLEAEAKS